MPRWVHFWHPDGSFLLSEGTTTEDLSALMKEMATASHQKRAALYPKLRSMIEVPPEVTTEEEKRNFYWFAVYTISLATTNIPRDSAFGKVAKPHLESATVDINEEKYVLCLFSDTPENPLFPAAEEVVSSPGQEKLPVPPGVSEGAFPLKDSQLPAAEALPGGILATAAWDEREDPVSPKIKPADPGEGWAAAIRSVMLDNFVVPPNTRLLGYQIEGVTFPTRLEVFDAHKFSTDEEGLFHLRQKLSNVVSIGALRLSDFGRFAGQPSSRILDCFPPTVWKTVRVLELDYRQLPVIEQHLTGSTSLECLICLDSDPTTLKLPSLRELYLGVCHRNPVLFLKTLKSAFPLANVWLNGKRHDLSMVPSSWKYAQDPPHQLISNWFPYVLERDFVDDSTMASLPQGGETLNERASAHHQADMLRDWCNSSLFEQEHSRTAELHRIRVAVLDSGIDPTHPDFSRCLKEVANFVPNESFIDLNGHGTHCAGIIAGDKGGIVPGVMLFVAKVLNRRGKGRASWVTAAVRWAIERRVDIISISLVMPAYDHDLHDAIQAAISTGIIVICAAGNSGSRHRLNLGFPASIAGTIRVGSIDHTGASSAFSSVGGPQIDAAAIGESIRSTGLCIGNGPRYTIGSGTSMAAPVIAAICAMLLAYDRSLGPAKIVNAHCMKDILGKLCFNSSQEVAKGRGSPDLAHVFRVPAAFKDHLAHIC